VHNIRQAKGYTASAMPDYERPLVADLVRRLTDGRDLIVAIFGPRQTGKTTAIRQAIARCGLPAIYRPVDAAADPHEGGVPERPAERDHHWLAARWEEARREARRRRAWVVLVFDEIQRAPDWSLAVKGLWDQDRRRGDRVRAVVLGSAPMLMQQGLTESLAGRFQPFRVTHWSFGEMSGFADLTLDEFLWYGGYPRARDFYGRFEEWAEYVRTSLVETTVRRDVLAMTRVGKPALLERLLRVGSRLSGQIVAYRKLLGHLHDAGNATTLARYLDLLEQVGLLAGLPKYARQQHRRRAAPPKLNVLNTALLTTQAGHDFESALADRSFRGRLVESAVGAHLFLTKAPGMELHYWREDDREVDFVTERNGRLYAIEVKSGAKTGSGAGLEAFCRRFPEAVPVVVGGGRGEPLDEVLSTPAPEWLDSL